MPPSGCTHATCPQVFDQFLKGTSLTECYDAVAAVANRWLDLLDTRGTDLQVGS